MTRLLRYAGLDGKCYPRVKTLCAELSLKERQTQNYLTELSARGFIRRIAPDRSESV